MSTHRSFARALLLALSTGACIAPSVLPAADRAVVLHGEDLDWRPAAAGDLPGTFVSTELSGPLAVSLRKVVYLFEPDGGTPGARAGTYTGAGLVDGDPPRFESVGGRWAWTAAEGLRLDGGPPALVEVAGDGSLRLSGEEGRIVLRREKER